MKTVSLSLLVQLFSVQLSLGSYGASKLKLADLLPEDPRNYDKMRPPRKDGQPTSVYIHVTVMGIDSINENSMTYAADIFFAQTWEDHRLRLPENMTSEYRLLEVEWLNNMWRPDSYFKNAKQVIFQTMTIPNHYVWLYQNKRILYMVKLTLTLSCAMNYAIYPHDTQECRLQIESLSHTTEDLIFAWDIETPLVVDENIELPQFDLVKNTTDDCTQLYSTGNFTCIEVVFTLKRRLGYYLFHTYIPTCLIVIMSWISFWIKPEAAPARVTLGVTSLLTLSTQHAKSQASLPPVSYIKIIDMFMNTCTVFVFLALMEYALVNIILGDGPDAPQVMKSLLPPSATKTTSPSSGHRGTHDILIRLGPQTSRMKSLTAKRTPKISLQCPVTNASDTAIPLTVLTHNNSPSLARTPSVVYKCGHRVLDTGYLEQPRLSTSSDTISGEAMGEDSTSYLQKSVSRGFLQKTSQLPGTGHLHQHCRSLSLEPSSMYHELMKAAEKVAEERTMLKGSCQTDCAFHNNKECGGSCSSRYKGTFPTASVEPQDDADIHQESIKEVSKRGKQKTQRGAIGSLPPPPPPPSNAKQDKSAVTKANAQKRRAKAIVVDRFSRVFFPVTFGLMNFIYWAIFWSYL